MKKKIIALVSIIIIILNTSNALILAVSVEMNNNAISVTGIKLDYNDISIMEGTSATLTATIIPDNADNKIIYWSSSDENIATVDNGTVNGISPGNAEIIAITDDGGYLAVCNVKVEAVAGSGYCGNNLKWCCTYLGELIITGTGEMWDYSSCDIEGTTRSTAPWRDLNIKSISLPDGITHIGDLAFFNLENGREIENVELPHSITSIGYAAFSNLNLTSINLPNSLLSIGNEAFCSTKIETLDIPDSVVTVGNSAFMYCNKLKSVKLSNSLTQIEHSTFWACGLTSIDIPSSVVSIGRGAFLGNQFTEVIVPNSVQELSSVVFAECKNLREIKFPDEINKFGTGMVSWCENLVTVDLPKNITVIPSDTFKECKKLSEIILPDSIESIGNDAFRDAKLSKIVFSDNVKSIGSYAFSNSELSSVYYYGNELDWDSIEIEEGNSNLIEANRYDIFLDNKNIIYTGEAVEPKVIVTHNNIKLTEEKDYLVEYFNNTYPGNALLKIDFLNNESIKIPFVINKIDASNAIINDIEEFIYNGEEKKPSVTVTLNGTKLEENIDYKVEYSDNLNAGMGKCIINFIGFYQGRIIKEFKINSINATDATVEKIDKQFYTGTYLKPETNVYLNEKKLVEGTDYTTTYVNNTDAGTARIFITFIKNYYRSTALQTSFEIVYEWDEGTVIKEPTCVEQGELLYKCKANPNIQKIEPIDLIEHTWDEGKITKYPTTTEEGILTYTCKNCNTTKTEVIEKIKCVVKFIDWDGTELKIESVECNENATAPNNPERAGYVFIGWDKTFNNITEDVTITAQYILKGDINADGKINARDAKMALQHFTGKIKLTEKQQAVADVNADGKINARDAKLILQYFTGKIKEFK